MRALKRIVRLRVMTRMDDGKIYEEASEVTAKDGAVKLDGPDAVDVAMTPEAAEETAERMADQAVMARGQRIMKGISLRPSPK